MQLTVYKTTRLYKENGMGKTVEDQIFDFEKWFKDSAAQHKQEKAEAEKPFNDFVTDKNGFVDPEKVEAVLFFGLEKAKELWANGKEPEWRLRNFLQERSCSRALMKRK